VLRGLPTMKLRFDAHDAAARKVAAWLKARPEIVRVLHPAFEDCPGHDIWKRDFSGAGGLFSVLFDARYTEAQTDRFVDALKLFGIGYSWGGANSLVMPYRMQGMRRGWEDAGTLVRFNIGLEDTDDLIADLEQAFGAVRERWAPRAHHRITIHRAVVVQIDEAADDAVSHPQPHHRRPTQASGIPIRDTYSTPITATTPDTTRTNGSSRYGGCTRWCRRVRPLDVVDDQRQDRQQAEREEEGEGVHDVQDARELLGIFDAAFKDQFLGHASPVGVCLSQ
jgi:hypothetical protein